MDKKDEWRIALHKAIAYFGEDQQVTKAVEEMAELIKALVDPRIKEPAIISEIADCLIMLWQLAIIFGESEVINKIEYKLGRLAQKIDEETAADLC